MEESLRFLLREKLIVILPGCPAKKALAVADALYEGGVRCLGITFRAADRASWSETADAIAAVSKAYDGRMLIGGGTVLYPEQVELCRSAGARFVISPDCFPPVIERARALGMLSIPGTQTATEAMTAARAGAELVSLFPAGTIGAKYFLDISKPLEQIRFLAIGGLTPGNIPEFADAGACGYAVSSGILNPSLLESGNMGTITANAAVFVKAVRAAHRGRE